MHFVFTILPSIRAIIVDQLTVVSYYTDNGMVEKIIYHLVQKTWILFSFFSSAPEYAQQEKCVKITIVVSSIILVY